jgi:hypothetical protein
MTGPMDYKHPPSHSLNPEIQQPREAGYSQRIALERMSQM